MIRNSKQDYIAKHLKIRNKLIELSKAREYACFNIARIAADLKMDIRTVRAHLRIMELDAMGTFLDDSQKQFCTKEGISLLVNTLRVHEKSNE